MFQIRVYFGNTEMNRFAALALMALLPACATIGEGTSDNVTVSTTPAGATCTLDRKGERIGALATTPGSLRIDKSVHPMMVTCNREGFQTASTTATPAFTGWTFGNLILGGIIGIVVDIASGANGRYPSEVQLTLTENPRPAEPPPPPVAMEPVDSNPVRTVVHQQLRGPGT